jgi:hypothetical protein
MSWHNHKQEFFDKHSNLRILLLGVSAILIWRGVWGLFDIYLFPDDPIVSFSISIIAGLLLVLIINNKRLRDFG